MNLSLNQSFWSRDVLTCCRILVLAVSTLLVVTALFLSGALRHAEKECYEQTKIPYNDCLQRNYDFIWSPSFWVLMMPPSFLLGLVTWFLIPGLPEERPESRSAI